MWVELVARAEVGCLSLALAAMTHANDVWGGGSVWNPQVKDRLARLGGLGFLEVSSKGLDLGIGSLCCR